MDIHAAFNAIVADLTPQPWDYTTSRGVTLTAIPAGLAAAPGDAEIALTITVSHHLAARVDIPTRDLPELIAALQHRAGYSYTTYLDGSTLALAHRTHSLTITLSDALWHGTAQNPGLCAIELPDTERLPLASALTRALDVARAWED